MPIIYPDVRLDYKVATHPPNEICEMLKRFDGFHGGHQRSFHDGGIRNALRQRELAGKVKAKKANRTLCDCRKGHTLGARS
jgi:hypothetical protein